VDSSSDIDRESDTLIDEQLLPYLNSANHSESQEHLNRLLEKARPIVYRIARSVRVGAERTVAPFNSHDIFGEVCVRLLQSLRAVTKTTEAAVHRLCKKRGFEVA